MKINIRKSVLLLGIMVVLGAGVVAVGAEEDRWEWTHRRSASGLHLHQVIWGNGRFMAIGYASTIIHSEDSLGIGWRLRNDMGIQLISIVHYGEQFWIGSYYGIIHRLTSSHWFTCDCRSGSSLVVWRDELIGVSSDTAFVLRDPIRITSSSRVPGSCTDGAVSCDLPMFKSVAYSDSLIVAVAKVLPNENSYLLTSPDALNWEVNRSLEDRFGKPYSVAYGGGMFLAAGECNSIARSYDGKNWEVVEVVDERYQNGYAVVYGDGYFVIAGEGGIFSTVDGENFVQMSSRRCGPATAMAYNGNGVYVTVDEFEIGTLSKVSVSVFNPGQGVRGASGFTMRQNGRMLKITMPNQNAHPQIALFNIAGRRQRVEPVFNSDGSVSMSLSNLAAGSYILRVNDGKNSWQRRVLLK